MNEFNPPGWAEALLRFLLSPKDRQAVSGDLLEEYRESIRPQRGQDAADYWYIRQVTGFAFYGNWIWAALLSGTFIARTAYDWFVPTDYFQDRSLVSTWLVFAILVSAGFRAAWQSGLLRSGLLAGIATTALSAVISILGVGSLYLVWHDPSTLAAIQGSGGLAEALMLPLMLVVPGMLLGAFGGMIGGLVRRTISA